MNLEILRNNFSQFSDNICIRAEFDSTTLTAEVSKSEIPSAAFDLIDVAIDMMRKRYGSDTDFDNFACLALEEINRINKESRETENKQQEVRSECMR